MLDEQNRSNIPSRRATKSSKPSNPFGLRCRKGRWILSLASGLLVIVVVASAASVGKCDASPTFGRRQGLSSSSPAGGPRPPFQRRMRTWLILNASRSKISATMRQRKKHSATATTTNKNNKRGSFMTIQHPTKKRLYQWFGMDGEEPNQFVRCMMLRNEFNHNVGGITNPFLKILRSSSSSDNDVHAAVGEGESSTYPETDASDRQIFRPMAHNDNRRHQKAVLASSSNNASPRIALGSSADVEKSWWPSLQITKDNDNDNDSSSQTTNRKLGIPPGRTDKSRNSFREQDWRILTYRKRVGRGRDCYNKVRDAALDWEFQSRDGSTGMLQVPDTRPAGTYDHPAIGSNRKRLPYSVRSIDDDPGAAALSNPLVSSSSSYRSLGSRRLVSYASKSVAGFLPSFLRKRIYSINPVMVVYDVVDQRAPDGLTTFTSTAYATLKGHFLRGEERVTVALRDGSQDVEVEILSISRAGPSLFGKTLWPFIGTMQSKFFQQQLEHLSESGLVLSAGNDQSPKIMNCNYLL